MPRLSQRASLLAMLFLAIALAVPLLAARLQAAPPDGSSWRYYRPGNTGVMGDYSDALWIEPGGTLYLGGYDPTFEEGGFSKFIEAENRWENYSNVDYPIIGSSANVGAARISDIVPDADGALWMGTWRGALHFDPAAGPSSLTRYDASNSPLPGGRTMDVSVAPDGTLWFACFSVTWGGGGLARFDPDTDAWTLWDSNSTANGWPGWIGLEAAVVQPKPSGGYHVWIDDPFGIAQFDSDTQLFTVLPQTGAPGEVRTVLPNSCDDEGNVWMLRETTPGQPTSLDYRRMDGVWVTPPEPYLGVTNDLWAFRALGDREALVVDGSNNTWRFDGSSWSNLGQWRTGAFTYGIDMDDFGNVWVSGNGGAARRDAETGQWQRYRITNTGQIDNFLRDISLAPDGDVWVTGNAGSGVGGIGVYDGERWHNHNIYTYGLGEDWPFPTDNADAIAYRPSNGHIAFNPMFSGIREWTGSGYMTFENWTSSEGMVEDSRGRLWTIGEYYSLRYRDETGFHPVTIAGWGGNVVQDPDRPGTVWACANIEVVRADGSYRFSRLNTDLPELNSQHDVLSTVAAAPGGIAWVGSTEGLFRIDANDGTHEWWHSSNSDMPGDQVSPLVVSPDGLVWFTNFGSDGIEASLVYFDGVEFNTVTRGEGLPHAQIWDAEVREISGGYEIWLSCASRGIAVLTVPLDDPADVVQNDWAMPARLSQNTPNPFRGSTTMDFALEVPGAARLGVFDVAGRLVRKLVDGALPPGPHRETWDARDERGREVRSGVYFYRLETPTGIEQRRMTVVR